MTEPTQTLEHLSAKLSLRTRVRYLVVLLAAATVTVLTALLWWTEPDLPLRTELAFGAIVAVGAGWSAYAAVALRRCGRLFALDRLVAGWLTLLFALLATAGCGLLVLPRGGDPAVLVIAGVVLLPVAGLILARAYADRRRLLRLRSDLVLNTVERET